MKKRLILYISLVVTTALLLMFGLGILVTRSNNNDITENNLIQTTRIYAGIYNGDVSDIKHTDNDIRITVVAADGWVIADTSGTDLSSMENHIQREEIINALNDSPQSVIRYSPTLGKDMMYYAEKVTIGDSYVFIRAATPTQSITAYLIKTIPLTLLILLCILSLTTIFAMLICDKLTKPFSTVIRSLQAVNNGTYTKTVSAGNYVEIDSALSEINDLAEKISNNIEEANRTKLRLDYIINNINDGIIVVNENKDVCMVNAKASEIFGATIDLVGKSVESLMGNKSLLDAIDNCTKKGTTCVLEVNIDSSVFLVTVKRLSDFWQESSNVSVAILSDITQSKHNEKMRSEFFANASHELKTPLTTIKGFNEIISLSNKDKNLVKPIAQIAKESDRMLRLIDDMLKLSKLENTDVIEKTDLSLASVIGEVVESLTIPIKEKNVSVTVTGNATIKANQTHIYELLKNLTENAVRYNSEGGKVNIIFSQNTLSTVIEISDTGIGIDSIHQSRIFERFYRVETSRSRQSGGTGLGLAIVKHICMLYYADLALKSQLGVGTTVTITFNK